VPTDIARYLHTPARSFALRFVAWTLALGYDLVGWTLGLLVAGLALAAAATGICAGCEIYKLLARVRGIELCATCVGGTALPSEE